MKTILKLLLVLFCITSCIDKPEFPEETDLLNELNFPEGFDFKTSRNIEIEINDTPGNVIYEVRYQMNGLDYLTGKYNSINGKTSLKLVIPTAIEEVEVIRRSSGQEVSYFIDAAPPVVAIDMTQSQAGAANNSFATNSGCIDRLYAVENSSGGFWSIDLSMGDYQETTLPSLQGGGSIACALDQENGLLYYNVQKTLYQYDIANNSFSVAHEGNPFNGNYPRLEYSDGFLWMSNGTKLYKVDAQTNETVASYQIEGFVNNSGGGDLAFDSNGTLYLACFSGLYKFTGFSENKATIVRISAENFPFQLTSMAIDRDDRIFVGTNDTNSNLIQISKEDGAYQIVKTYDHKINDLTAWRCGADELPQQDSDNDGIIDELDDYPNDPDVAFDSYTPSALGMGTLAFEDLWPMQGDYDFNDMVLSYRFTNVMNSNNQSVRLLIDLTLKATGASNHSGFGIELPFDKTDIQSVSGYRLNGGLIALDNNGLEAGQSKAVVIVFNDSFDHLSPNSGAGFVNTIETDAFVEPVNFQLIIEFVNPIDSSPMSLAPFNPFIFSSYERGKEIHLSGMEPTSLVTDTYFGTEKDDTSPANGKYYQNANNMPWAINVIHNFRYPKEKSRIDGAYNRFADWGKSNGTTYRDWYSDNSGYRNVSRIYFRE